MAMDTRVLTRFPHQLSVNVYFTSICIGHSNNLWSDRRSQHSIFRFSPGKCWHSYRSNCHICRLSLWSFSSWFHLWRLCIDAAQPGGNLVYHHNQLQVSKMPQLEPEETGLKSPWSNSLSFELVLAPVFGSECVFELWGVSLACNCKRLFWWVTTQLSFDWSPTATYWCECQLFCGCIFSLEDSERAAI